MGSWDDFKAEKERELEFGKLKQKTDLKITAWKITIIQTGDREEIEDYSGKNKIKLAVITETRKDVVSKEVRKRYTWYHSGNEDEEEKKKKDDRPYAGVSIVINNELNNLTTTF